MGIAITGVNNNDAAFDGHYFNVAAEMWWQLAGKLRQREIILPWDDEVLKKQLLNREEVYREVGGRKVYGREDGRLQLMPKSRLSTKSPDRADAVVGAAFDWPGMAPVKAMGVADNSWMDGGDETDAGAMPRGAWCG
jgi:hypothetical protein